MKRIVQSCLGVLLVGMLRTVVIAQDQNRAPTIKHEPVSVAVRGQPITILANVQDDSGLVKTVTLFYSPSKDAAPFRVPMKSSGTSLYYGSIPASVISGVRNVSYYIEALDHVDSASETAWHTIVIQDPSAAPKPVEPSPTGASVAPSSGGERSGPSLLTVGAIAAGAAVVVGGAALVAGRGSGGGGGDEGGDVQVGTFVGSSTECTSLEGANPACGSHGVSIVISDAGTVSSSSLREGVLMQGPLRGSDFTLVAQLTGVSTGEVVYTGTVVDQRIVGSITGSSQSAAGRTVYSGTFTANRN